MHVCYARKAVTIQVVSGFPHLDECRAVGPCDGGVLAAQNLADEGAFILGLKRVVPSAALILQLLEERTQLQWCLIEVYTCTGCAAQACMDARAIQ